MTLDDQTGVGEELENVHNRSVHNVASWPIAKIKRGGGQSHVRSAPFGWVRKRTGCAAGPPAFQEAAEDLEGDLLGLLAALVGRADAGGAALLAQGQARIVLRQYSRSVLSRSKRVGLRPMPPGIVVVDEDVGLEVRLGEDRAPARGWILAAGPRGGMDSPGRVVADRDADVVEVAHEEERRDVVEDVGQAVEAVDLLLGVEGQRLEERRRGSVTQ